MKFTPWDIRLLRVAFNFFQICYYFCGWSAAAAAAADDDDDDGGGDGDGDDDDDDN